MTSSLKEYLKTIYLLITSENIARVTDIALQMNCSKPSVNRALNILKNEGYIKHEAYKKVTLTSKGREYAKSIIKAQNAIEIFLKKNLKVDENIAKEEASIMSTTLSESTIEKFEKYVKNVVEK